MKRIYAKNFHSAMVQNRPFFRRPCFLVKYVRKKCSRGGGVLVEKSRNFHTGGIEMISKTDKDDVFTAN